MKKHKRRWRVFYFNGVYVWLNDKENAPSDKEIRQRISRWRERNGGDLKSVKIWTDKNGLHFFNFRRDSSHDNRIYSMRSLNPDGNVLWSVALYDPHKVVLSLPNSDGIGTVVDAFPRGKSPFSQF